MISKLVSANPDVLIILHDLRGGGAERAMLRLATGMAEAGIAVEMLLIQRFGEYLDEVPEGISLHSLDLKSVSSALVPLARYLRQRKPASILSALTHVNVVAILSARLARYKGPVIVSERNHISSKARDASTLRDRFTYHLVKYIYPLATRVVAVSSGVAQDLIKFGSLPSSLVTYIYNPVFDERLAIKAAEKPVHRWLNGDGSPVIVAFGRLHQQKDFPTLIRAFEIARKQIPTRLIIFGEGQGREALQALIDQSEAGVDIDLAGFTNQPLAAMGGAAVLALSSRWEGFPNVLVEGLVCGMPIVATDCPSGPEEILDKGRFGHLVPVGNAGAMAEAIVVSILNPPDRSLLRDRASIFSVQAAVGRYAELLNIPIAKSTAARDRASAR